MVAFPVATEGTLRDCRLLPDKSYADSRGFLRKVLSIEDGAPLSVSEIFWTRSRRGTIRGMHWQADRADGFKVVWVTEGLIRDVVLDLRETSATWLTWQVVELTPSSGAIYVPAGCAHGFEVLTESAVVNYAQEKPYSAELERGIHWTSIPGAWSVTEPIVSPRDSHHPSLEEFLESQLPK